MNRDQMEYDEAGYLVGAESLSLVEEARLTTLEAVVDAGMQTFVDVGNALLEIRDSRLYRLTHRTFEEYCRDKWQIVESRAYYLMGAATVATNLLDQGGLSPANVEQTIPLASLDPDAQREVWRRAVETAPNGKVTGAHVKATVNQYRSSINIEDANGHIETMLAPAQPAPDTMAVHYSSDTPEHYTPQGIIDLAIKVMGGIDLDPCSNSHDTPNVPAAQHFTQADDGLAQRWTGRVYMNPPYGREIGAWVSKLVESSKAGDVTEWIALVPGRIDTAWWQTLTDPCTFVCFVDGRLTFIGNDAPAPFPSAVVYYGQNFGEFYYTFLEIGYIWKLVNPEMDFGA